MKSKIKIDYKVLFLLTIFLLGLYYYTYSYKSIEQLENIGDYKCPNMLIEKDGEIYLYNSKLATVPGVNPIKFDSLSEYSEFLDWQTSQGINCPILYLQYTTDTQNNDLIQIKPSIFENHGGLPNQNIANLTGKPDKEYYEENKMLDATKNSTPRSKNKFNTGMYSGFDKHNQNIGLDTPLDKLFHENTSKSRNPYDTNWGGKSYTEEAVQRGDYKDREVYKTKLED